MKKIFFLFLSIYCFVFPQTPPPAPTNLQAIGGVMNAFLMWDYPESAQINGFAIERRHPTPDNPNDSYKVIKVVGPNERTYLDTPIVDEENGFETPIMPDSKPYYYRVRAYSRTQSETIYSSYSNEAWCIPTAFPPNENPTELEAFMGWNSIVVRWNDNTENESGYYIECWWNKIPDDITQPDSIFVAPGYKNYPYKGPVQAVITHLELTEVHEIIQTEIIITDTSIWQKGGRWYIRVNGIYKQEEKKEGEKEETGAETRLSWYAKPREDFPNKLSVPSGLREDQKTKYYAVWIDLPQVPYEFPKGTSFPGSCFIASVCFGENSWQVGIFKEFRDRILMKNLLGRRFINFYYTHSPQFAEFLQKKRVLILPVKFFLYILLIPVILILNLKILLPLFMLIFLLMYKRNGQEMQSNKKYMK